MIEAVIFDMDGVLLDSEPFWQEAEMEVFRTVGIELTRAQCIETTGLPVEDVVAFRYNQNPWKQKSLHQVSAEIVMGVEARIHERAVPLEGVPEILSFFKQRRIPLALASSSSMRMIRTVLKKVSLEEIFSLIHSAEKEEFGKPHPAVFITTAKQLHIPPAHCLVFEDSFNGLIAAKAARMKTVVLPMAEQRTETRFDIADLRLASLKEFTEEHWKSLNNQS